jgi:integrase
VRHNTVRATLSALFNWAISQGLIESNPVVGINKHKEKPRERVLSLPELIAIWHTVDDIHTITDLSAQIRLLMLTGQRRGEIGDLRWREVRDENFIENGAVITGPAIVLPPERTKNGRKHIVPLSKPVQTILFARLRGGDDEYVFRRKNNGPISGSWTRRKNELDHALRRRKHKLAPWTIHDLRRSAATHMGEMNIAPHVIEAVLNHVRGGIAGVYNLSKLEEPKRQALAAWAEYLMAHIEGRAPADNVVPLRA